MAVVRILWLKIHETITVPRRFSSVDSLFWSNFGMRKRSECHLKLFGVLRTFTTYSGLTKDKAFIHGFEELPELQRFSHTSSFAASSPLCVGADENVRRIFSLANASQKEKRKAVYSELIKNCISPQERKIAKMTISISNLEDHLQGMRNKDKHNKVFLQWLKDQRTKKLNILKTSSFERYVELVKDLNIEPISSTHSKYAKYKFRRFKIGVEIKEKRSLAVRKTPVLPKQAR